MAVISKINPTAGVSYLLLRQPFLGSYLKLHFSYIFPPKTSTLKMERALKLITPNYLKF